MMTKIKVENLVGLKPKEYCNKYCIPAGGDVGQATAQVILELYISGHQAQAEEVPAPRITRGGQNRFSPPPPPPPNNFQLQRNWKKLN